ncbi:PTS transporter subunit EIIC [Eubacterium multiforme]|uniref:PTS system sucrose-specific IIC component n=1 Tax=Eubacterium multiforme TaxID=83339 RepID=A0ABT9UWZ7_9FIRM|nr:PTS transporter subunit EIIC [Eubacterium multiforme]MDQ0150835.1 PTS system sucrose-specific IIC component [Eubacterium multiforme]
MSKNFEKLAKDILEVVGGKSNVKNVTNCMTRLRLEVVDGEKVDKEKLKNLDGVLGLVEEDDQLQIVIGPGKVNKVKNEFSKLIGDIDEDVEKTLEDAKKLKSEIKKKNQTPVKLVLKKVANIFIPLIPAFIACGLVTSILNIILKIDPSLASSSFISLLKVAGNSVFFGLNLFVGVSAAKEFGGSPMLGGVMAAVISHPALSNISLFGEKLVPGRGGIIAVLLVVAFSSWLEKKVREIVPNTLDLFLTPLIVILVSTFVAVYALQPIGGFIAEGIGDVTKVAIEKGGVVAGFVLGGTFLPLVMTGLHQGLTPIHAQLLSSSGIDILLPILAMAGAGQVGASFAVYRMTKNERIKKTIASSLPVGMLGVGEPLIYGVTLPLGRPFIGACIGGAFGGAVQAALKVGATSMGLSGIPLAATTNNAGKFLIGLLVAYIAGYIATRILKFNDPVE